MPNNKSLRFLRLTQDFPDFSCNDFVTELCLKWAFECLSVVHRINRKSPVKR